MFLAIINDTYSEVKSDITSGKSDLEFGAYFKRGYDKIMNKLHLKKEKLVDIQNALESADINSDKTVTFAEWKSNLKKKGFSEVEIDAHFAKYDLDGNQMLSPEEQKQMSDDLKKQSKELDEDIDDMKQTEPESYE
jgi:polycystin 2